MFDKKKKKKHFHEHYQDMYFEYCHEAENNVFAISSSPTRHQDQLRKITVFQTFLSANDPEHIGGEWTREFIRNPVLIV